MSAILERGRRALGWVIVAACIGSLLGCSGGSSSRPADSQEGGADSIGMADGGEAGQAEQPCNGDCISCSAGASRCVDNQLEVCNARGDGKELTPCPGSTTCEQDNGIASCKAWVCTPNTASCDDAGQLERCASDGLSLSSTTDCSAQGKLCREGECVLQQCDPSSRFCDGQELRQCSADGLTSDPLVTCSASETCVAASATCVAKLCQPEQRACAGNAVTLCNASGSAFEPTATVCGALEACYEGSCKPRVCDGPYCKDGDVWACLEQGTLTQLAQACSSTELCSNGSCEPTQCTPGTAICAQGHATVCASNGAGPVPGGTDCAAAQQACVNGACKPIVCEPGAYYCGGGHPQLCNTTGTASSQQTDTCLTAEFCAPGSATCQADTCQPQAALCTGNVASTCAADGSGPVSPGTDCSANGKLCEGGVCRDKVCEPNAFFCKSGSVHLCGATGTSSSQKDACSSKEFCQPGLSTCQADVCTAGQPVCVGDWLSTCAADGSGAADAGTPCAANKICDSASCKDIICSPGALKCSANDVHKCNQKGTAWVVEQVCASSSYCKDTAAPIACAEDVCEPGTSTCNGEALATCSADGGHYTSTSTDCAATGKLCTLAGTCASSIVDDVGANATSHNNQASYFEANVYRVDRTRTLTQIEHYAGLTGTKTLHFAVYEGQAGDLYPYIFQTKLAEVTTTSSGTGFHISGPLDVRLEAGKVYLIGMLVPGPASSFSETTPVRKFVSFGQVMTSLSEDGTTPKPSYTAYVLGSLFRKQRVTTAPPH